MARGVIRSGPAAPGPPRSARFVALCVAVLVVHGFVSREIGARMESLAAAARMPARIEVAYVRTLEPEAPPALAPALSAPPPPITRPRVARARPARPASAPDPATADAAAGTLASAASEAAAASAPQSEEPAPTVAAAAPETPTAPPTTETRPASSPDSRPPPVPAAGPDVPRTGAAATASAAPATAASAAGLPFDWPASTRVSYTLTGNYRGEVSGGAQVEWVRVGSRYQVHLDLLVGPSFAPLITRRMSSEGDLTSAGLAPTRYDEETHVAMRDPRRFTMRFEPDAVVLANGDRRERWPGVQDTASQFIQLTWLFTTRPDRLKVGNTVEVPLALARNVDRWTYDVLEETEVSTPFGPLPAFHLKPRRTTAKPGDLTAEIWFAPQLRYLPVRIRIEQDAQTWIDLVIVKKPELAAEATR